MASPTKSETSSCGDYFEPVENTLTDLTGKILPGYANKILATKPGDLEPVMSDLIIEADQKRPKDTALTKTLGRLSVVFFSRFKHAHQTLEQKALRLKAKVQKIAQLQGDNESLQHKFEILEKAVSQNDARITGLTDQLNATKKENLELTQKNQNLEQSLQNSSLELSTTQAKLKKEEQIRSESVHSLSEAQCKLQDLKCDISVYEKHLDSKQEKINLLQKQLTETTGKLDLVSREKEDLSEMLMSIRTELLQLLQTGQKPAIHDIFRKCKKDLFSDRKSHENYPCSPLSSVPQSFSSGPQRCPQTPDPGGTNHTGDPSGTHSQQVPTDNDLFKLARNIARFDPTPGGSHDIRAYLNDINFYLERYPHASVDDKICLIRLTASRDVIKFIERQTDDVQNNYFLLCQALEQEFLQDSSQSGLAVALTTKQGRKESPQVYYHRLFTTYFGQNNYPDMEEDVNFKTLFVQNLHPVVSRHLGILANPHTCTIQKLREWANLGFQKHLQAKYCGPDTVFALADEPSSNKMNHLNCHAVSYRSESPPSPETW